MFTTTFPISRDPPEGGTIAWTIHRNKSIGFPISRDPPEGGTWSTATADTQTGDCFQFLGIPPKGEHEGY